MSRRLELVVPLASLLLGTAACDAGLDATEAAPGDETADLAAEAAPGASADVLATAAVIPDREPVEHGDGAHDDAHDHAHAGFAAGAPGRAARAALCVAPRFDVGAERLASPVASFPTFESPRCAFNSSSGCGLATFDAAAAEAFLDGLKARLPMYLPYTRSDVALGQGWIYNSGGSHRGQDYSRTDAISEGEDPTFEVRAVAPGVVRVITYSAGGGNTVGIEHTAPDGSKYYTYYMHLRDGRANDVSLALTHPSIVSAVADGDDRCTRYQAYATDFDDHPSWGTDAQTIAVEVGDVVQAGDFIAWAGNTGCGGAGAGLEADGSPKSHKGNVHLHTYWGVAHPSKPGVAVQFDPYGVYEEASTGCYDLLKVTAFRRFIAPFYPTFHGVSKSLVDFYFHYYPGMGRGLRTWHLDDDAQGQVRVVGSFQTGVGAFLAKGWQTWDAYQDDFAAFSSAGWRPREVTVAIDAQGARRVSSLWQPLEAGESFVSLTANLRASWPATFAAWGDAGRRVYNHFGYRYNGVDYHAVGGTSDWDGGYKIFTDRTSAEMDAKLDEQVALGWVPESLTVNEYGATRLLSGIFRKKPGCWKARWGLTPAAYQDYVSAQSAAGYRLVKAQSYADVTRYLVLLTRSAPANGVCP
jgi:murein DD-endopeptidase MepM/ murein hydrolase activator NlpD